MKKDLSVLLALGIILVRVNSDSTTTVTNQPEPEIKSTDSSITDKDSTVKPETDTISSTPSTNDKMIQSPVEGNTSIPERKADTVNKLPAPIIMNETESAYSDLPVYNINESDKGRCVTLDLRMCLQNHCKLYRAKCVETITLTKSPYPVPLPDNFEDVVNLFKIMWENPPAQGNPTLWLVYIAASATLVVVIANMLIFAGLFMCIRKCWRCCKRRNGKNGDGKKMHRVTLVLPQGRKVAVGDYIIDCTGSKPHARRVIRRPDELFRSYHASLSSRRSSRNAGPHVARNKEDLEHPPSWPYEGDGEEYSITTASVSRTTKTSSPTTHLNSFGAGPSFSVNGEASETVSSSNFVNPAFSVSSLGSDDEISPRHVVARDEEWEDATDLEQSQSGTLNENAIVTSVDETVSGVMSDKNKEIPLSSSPAEPEDLTKKNAVKVQSLQSKLKKVDTPQIPAMKPNDENLIEVVAIVEKAEEKEAK